MADIVNPLPLTAGEMKVQQDAIDRQRKIAEYLQQSSLTPDQGQMVSGHYVKPSGTQYLAKLAQGLLGRSQQTSLDDKQMQLAKQNGDIDRYNFGIGASGTENPAPTSGTGLPASKIGGETFVKAAANAGLGTDKESLNKVVSLVNDGMTPDQAANSLSANGGKATPSVDGAKIAQALMGNQAQPKSVSQGYGDWVLPGLSNRSAFQLNQSFPKEYAAARLKQIEPTELMRTIAASGIDPRSPQGQQILAANINKTNYIAPENIRPGGYTRDVAGKVTHYPLVPEGSQAVPDGNGGFKIVPVEGSLPAITSLEEAKLQGKNKQTLAPKDILPTNSNGTVTPKTIDATINGPQATNNPAQNGAQGLDLSKLSPPQQAFLAQKDPQAFANGVADFQRTSMQQPQSAPDTPMPGVGAPWGQQHGAEAAQTELSKKWTTLNDANQQAQTTNSYLQNIKGLAAKAIVGPQADKLAYTNGLLAMVGNEKAIDTATANNLLDKYSNQITARLGQGGLGTDAGRAILQSAYPNSHMTVQAIHDAVDNLVGANEMTKAKASLLSGHATSRNPAAYQERELAFDKAADPRIWQWKNMTDPAAKKAFAASVMKVDPTFPQRIDALEQLGVFK